VETSLFQNDLFVWTELFVVYSRIVGE
jgi:hypothetical protein